MRGPFQRPYSAPMSQEGQAGPPPIGASPHPRVAWEKWQWKGSLWGVGLRRRGAAAAAGPSAQGLPESSGTQGCLSCPRGPIPCQGQSEGPGEAPPCILLFYKLHITLREEEAHGRTHTHTPLPKEPLLWSALGSKQGFKLSLVLCSKQALSRSWTSQRGQGTTAPLGGGLAKGAGAAVAGRRATKQTWERPLGPSEQEGLQSPLLFPAVIPLAAGGQGGSGTGTGWPSRFLAPRGGLHSPCSPPPPPRCQHSGGGGRGRVHLSREMSSAKWSWPRRKQRRQRHCDTMRQSGNMKSAQMAAMT